tara:strand:+ start:498 stop:1415 length:918 start_codon:yes stop_codon:yes gene_type:complete
MARRYVRDARGRFAPKGYSGQTGGRGARLKSGKGNIRQVGGQKRGERHILRSPESKAAGKRSFDASVAHARLTLPKNLGGQGMPRDSFLARAAKAKKVEANAAAKAARRKTGLPESSVRLSRRVKRDPKVGEKLTAAKAKAATKPKTSKRQAAKSKDGRDIMLADVRKTQNKRLKGLNQKIKDAGTNAAGLRLEKLQLQTRMSATRPKQTAKQKAKSDKQDQLIRARIAEMRRQSARQLRAQANLARTADTRNKPGSTMIRRPSQKMIRGNLRAERALEFYKDPKKALKSVNKTRRGFRMPRSMR